MSIDPSGTLDRAQLEINRARREQRERIATAAIHGFYANSNTWCNVPEVRQQLRAALIEDALALADELIAALNKS